MTLSYIVFRPKTDISFGTIIASIYKLYRSDKVTYIGEKKVKSKDGFELKINVVDDIENIDVNIKNTFDKLNEFENQIKELIERENEEKKEHRENSCPICLEEFKPTSYFMPPCGHKICLHCFTRNMIKNQSTGGYCCLCREKIIPKI